MTENQQIARQNAELVQEVTADFLARQQSRRALELKWQLCQNYLAGNQYVDVTPRQTVEETEKPYGWSFRGVYNNIAPVIESRLAKLSRVRPKLIVRPATDEESDLRSAELASNLLAATADRICLSDVVERATVLSETYGTAFYQILWNPRTGKTVGIADGKSVKEGDVAVLALSPFEIYPDSLTAESLAEVKSLIHAKAVSVETIAQQYGKKVEGKGVDVYTLTDATLALQGEKRKEEEGKVLLIERYERESEAYPNGRLVVVAGDTLLYSGDLPYENGEDGQRDFPFVRQTALLYAGNFFGTSMIERLIPLQRAYNAVKNRKHELLNRLANGVLTVEDGSVDTDDLLEDGLAPGKVVVYRQGSNPPAFLAGESFPKAFAEEEERLAAEFMQISGVSEISRNSQTPLRVTSGTALQLLIEQEENRISMTADAEKRAIVAVGKQILRLLRSFAGKQRIMRCGGTGKRVQMYYFSESDLTSDDVAIDAETELSSSPAQVRSMILELLSANLLTDEKGKLSAATRKKLLRTMGYGTLADGGDLSELHVARASEENLLLRTKEVAAEEYDDHDLHVVEHTRYLLSEQPGEEEKARIIAHVRKHKAFNAGGNYGE
ncbi:MAG: hypothetical protein IIW27_05645 [Clostridia bacterium]|nr:hypothetical protein [Clostridia bacterium]